MVKLAPIMEMKKPIKINPIMYLVSLVREFSAKQNIITEKQSIKHSFITSSLLRLESL